MSPIDRTVIERHQRLADTFLANPTNRRLLEHAKRLSDGAALLPPIDIAISAGIADILGRLTR